MKLRIDQNVWEAMLRAARRATPLEACGLCGGKDGHVTQFYELANGDASGEHYRMLPEEQFAAVKAMRQAGVKMLAIWHSHPATPPRMSEEDLRLAFTPDGVYVILSLASEPPALGAYRIRDGAQQRVNVRVSDEEK